MFGFWKKEPKSKPLGRKSLPADPQRRPTTGARVASVVPRQTGPHLQSVATREPQQRNEEAQPESRIPVIYSVADLPKYTKIYTDNAGKFSLPEDKQKDCVAIGTDDGVWFLVTKDFHTTNLVVIRGLQERMRRIENPLTIKKTVFAPRELIAGVYESASRLRDEELFEEPVTPEGKLFDDIVRYGIENRATDIHFEIRGQLGTVRHRIDGDLEPMRNEKRGIYLMEQLRDAIGYAYNKLQSERTGSHSNFSPETYQSCMIPYQVAGMRMNLRYQSTRALAGFDVIVRYLFNEETVKTKHFQELGYSQDQAHMLEIASRTRIGMVMIAGITGSGKSTTLKTIIENIPDRAGLKVFTVEDPVEYAIAGVTQISIQRTAKADAENTPYREIQKVLMRCDPDTIMLGEIRDIESGETGQVLIETGHQVMATVHANSVFGVFPRLLAPNIGFALNTLTSPQFWSLIIYQALVPVLCVQCRIPAINEIPEKLNFIEERFKISTNNMFVKCPGGCKHCDNRGTTGLTVVAEMMQPSRQELRLIRESNEFEAERLWRGRGDGAFDSPQMEGKTVFEHALYKAFLGIIDPRVVERFETFERYEILNTRSD